MSETRWRSIVKSVVWRVIATTITLLTIYAFTGSLSGATVTALTAAVIAMCAYYVHERLWNRIAWGRVK